MLIYLEDLYHHGFCSFHHANVEVMVLHVVMVDMLLSTSMPSKYVEKGIHRPQQLTNFPCSCYTCYLTDGNKISFIWTWLTTQTSTCADSNQNIYVRHHRWPWKWLSCIWELLLQCRYTLSVLVVRFALMVGRWALNTQPLHAVLLGHKQFYYTLVLCCWQFQQVNGILDEQFFIFDEVEAVHFKHC